MDLEIQGKVMVVTGGASGIGAAIARRLTVEGAVPIIVDKNSEEGAKLVEELSNEGSEAYMFANELHSTKNCSDMIGEILATTGRIDGLFNNAGKNDGVGLEKGRADSFLKSLAANLHHYYFMGHACLEQLKQRKGVIINMSSKTALTGQGNTSGYAASKGGQLALTREWAVELLKYDIRVNAIVPAEVITPQYESWLVENFDNPDEARRQIEKKIPLGNRFTTPTEIADMAVFLASARADHITGQFIHVDGGYIHLDRVMDY